MPVGCKYIYMSWRQDLGAQIRREREAKGLSQQALAEKTSVSRVQIGNIEKGKSAPAVNIVTEIAVALSCIFTIEGIEIGMPAAARPIEAVPIQGSLQFDPDVRISARSVTITEINPNRHRIQLYSGFAQDRVIRAEQTIKRARTEVRALGLCLVHLWRVQDPTLRLPWLVQRAATAAACRLLRRWFWGLRGG